jgi:exopolysaccharide/PEP-CTERM locus tyrosine autokinase
VGKFSDAFKKSEIEILNKTAQPVIKEKIRDTSKNIIQIKESINIKKSTLPPGKKLAPTLVTVNNPHSFEAEQFRVLKTSLLFSSEERAPKTIMVTSAVPDEGKSFVASNLAVAFSQGVDEHVLLMDCDLRLPMVHRIFGFEDNLSGLSEVLSGEKDLKDVFVKTDINKLTLMTGGRLPSNPTELLSSGRMKNLLNEVKSRYQDRYIIIDSPPPLLASETIAISRQVDGIIIVVKHEGTPRNQVKEMVELFDREKIIGIVVNRYDVRLSRYYGYGKYGSYYGKRTSQMKNMQE